MSTGAIGSGIGMTTNLLGSWIDAKGAVHGAETEANAGTAAIGTMRNTTTEAIQADAAATAPQRGIGDLALYELAGLLGIDPSTAFPSSTGGSTSSTGGGAGGFSSTNMYGTQPNFEDIFSKPLSLDTIHGDPLQVFKDYKFTPYSLGSVESLIGSHPAVPDSDRPGSSTFGSFNRPFTMQDFFANVDPAYAFRQQQGQQAIENSAAAKGMQLSGSNLMALNSYGQNLASEEYQNAYNRYRTDQNTEFQRLASLAGVGANASAELGANAANLISGFGVNAANTQIGIGNALAAGQVGASNAISGGIRQSGQDTAAMMGGNTSSGSRPSGSSTPYTMNSGLSSFNPSSGNSSSQTALGSGNYNIASNFGSLTGG